MCLQLAAGCLLPTPIVYYLSATCKLSECQLLLLLLLWVDVDGIYCLFFLNEKLTINLFNDCQDFNAGNKSIQQQNFIALLLSMQNTYKDFFLIFDHSSHFQS